MKLLTITNLYPWPVQPQRGLFNAQQFSALARGLGRHASSIVNLCLVPEWRTWRWNAIRRWQDPTGAGLGTRYVPVFYLPVAGRSWNWRFYVRGLRGARELADSCDAVLATWLYPDAVAASVLAEEAGKPLWIKVHGTDRFHLDHPARRRAILRACGRAAGVFCVSGNVAAALTAAGVAAERVRIVPNGVDHERFRFRARQEALLSLGQAALVSGPVVLYVGNLAAIKGPDVLLEAWALIRRAEAGRSARLVIIGQGPMRRALERRAQQLGLGDSVVFQGEAAHEQVALRMNAADCLCLPSLSEGMPNVVIEALASGLPVVASDVGACRELLRGEPSSRLVPPRDSAALSAAILDVLSRAVDRGGMAARHAAEYSWDRSAERVLKIMKETIDEGRESERATAS